MLLSIFLSPLSRRAALDKTFWKYRQLFSLWSFSCNHIKNIMRLLKLKNLFTFYVLLEIILSTLILEFHIIIQWCHNYNLVCQSNSLCKFVPRKILNSLAHNNSNELLVCLTILVFNYIPKIMNIAAKLMTKGRQVLTTNHAHNIFHPFQQSAIFIFVLINCQFPIHPFIIKISNTIRTISRRQ